MSELDITVAGNRVPNHVEVSITMTLPEAHALWENLESGTDRDSYDQLGKVYAKLTPFFRAEAGE